MRYYFIRHGENPANVQKILSHRVVDFGLTERGITQATTVGEWLADKDIHHIYSSPLKRAIETAQIIGRRLGLEHRVIEELREMNPGIYDGRSDEEAWATHDKVWASWVEGDFTASLEEGEDGHTMIARLRRGLDEIEAEVAHTAPNVAVVGHGGMFFFGLPNLCQNLSFESVVKMNRFLVNTAICIIEKRDDQYYCVEWGYKVMSDE